MTTDTDHCASCGYAGPDWSTWPIWSAPTREEYEQVVVEWQRRNPPIGSDGRHRPVHYRPCPPRQQSPVQAVPVAAQPTLFGEVA